ncbi:MAG: hypothetical protein EA392_02435 [Cryomorphaceae bacterium]|nr:MAG: hypothetical protein EA392_02435 [Cryomorphaceae bacterium]
MSVYDDKLTSWLIQPDNFETAWEINEAFEKAKFYLVENFYESLKSALSDADELSALGYKFISSGTVDDSYPKLGFFKSNSNVRVQYERFDSRPYFGIWIHKSLQDMNNEEAALRHAEILKKSGYEGFDNFKRSQWWIGWQYIDVNFANYESLREILDDRRDKLINEAIERISVYAQAVLPFIEEIEGKLK